MGESDKVILGFVNMTANPYGIFFFSHGSFRIGEEQAGDVDW